MNNLKISPQKRLIYFKLLIKSELGIYSFRLSIYRLNTKDKSSHEVNFYPLFPYSFRCSIPQRVAYSLATTFVHITFEISYLISLQKYFFLIMVFP